MDVQCLRVLPLEHLEWDQPQPGRRGERNERSRRAGSTDDCENADDLCHSFHPESVEVLFHTPTPLGQDLWQPRRYPVYPS